MKPLYTFSQVLTLISRSGDESRMLNIVGEIVNSDFYCYTDQELDLMYKLMEIRLSKCRKLEFNHS
mgnify:CR=1 FL=1